jgi:CubicO group peptidase (beta-lactamase class C family)
MVAIARGFSSAAATVALVGSYAAAADDLRMRSAISELRAEDGKLVTVEQAMANHGLKGLSVAVIDDYQVSWSREWGVKSADQKDAIGSRTLFNIASIAKPVTATLIAILADKGLVDLDEPVSSYLQRWQLPDNKFTRSTDITLRHLLSHTSGATQHGYKDFYSGDEIPTLVDVLNGGDLSGTDALDIDFKPGSQWRYSGGGYVIAQIVVEDHLKKPLAELAAEHIFQPLDMTATTMLRPDEAGFPGNAAKAHDESGEVISTGLPICPQISASGLWTTPTDMARLLIEMQNALRGKGSGVISPAVAELATSEIMDGFGLGWALFEPVGYMQAFSHGGANTGTGGRVYATKDGGNGILLFGNGPNSIREPVIAMLRESIVGAHGWRASDETDKPGSTRSE